MTGSTVSRPLDIFTAYFGKEHRGARDLLLALVRAFEDRDQARARELLGTLARLAGPHFRYEEEALYPELVPLFGPEYVDKLLVDHDVAIDSARKLVVLADQAALTDDEIAEARSLVRKILPHVTDCDGLSIMVELLPESTVETLLETRKAAIAENLDLFAWAADARTRRGEQN